jgi:Ca-activated chloride channel homolog
MTLIWPWMLLSLLLVPLGGLLYWRLLQRRKRIAANLGALGLVHTRAAKPEQPAQLLDRWRHLPTFFYLAGLALLAFAMARPEMVVSLPRIEGTVILAFDVSASMAADDMEPSRIEAAKSAAKTFIQEQTDNIKIGLVAFSDGGLVVQTPTDDQAVLTEAIDRFIPQSGTSLGQGIVVALNTALENTNPDGGNASDPSQPSPAPAARGPLAPAVIVLLTDGEDTGGPDPLEAAQVAIEQGVRIYTVGVGSREGAVLEIEGFNVFTQLNEGLLKDIAGLTEGKYYYAANESALHDIYKNLDVQFVVKPEKMEITSLLAGLSFITLIVGSVFSLVWLGRIP